MRSALAALGVAVSATAAIGDGRDAFSARDYDAALRLWRQEAADGSADALLGLGFLHDLGLGVGRDPFVAFRYYLEAAQMGSVEAAFNVGVMLDAGTGTARSARAAALWYARAAVRGDARSRYNLGLLYEAGEGVPRNPDLAAYWFEAAAPDVPAAADRLDAVVEPGPRELSAPASGVAERYGDAVVMVWSAPPMPEGATFRVELLDLDGNVPTFAGAIETRASALALPPWANRGAWRVLEVDADRRRYAASAWQGVGAVEVSGPVGRVRIVAGDSAALGRKVRDALAPGDLMVEIDESRVGPAPTVVRYGFAQDESLAHDVAIFLPGFDKTDAVLMADAGLGPGEIEVVLGGAVSLPEKARSAPPSPRP